MENLNEKKQIEEMAKCCTYYHSGECCADVTNISDCDLMCEMFGVFANLEKENYRKQSEGEWIDSLNGYCQCSNCRTSFETRPTTFLFKLNNSFCRNCGAKMKGGAE
jgi:hypothetical protein